MDDRSPEQLRPVPRVHPRRWWPGPRVGGWPDAVQMALPVAAAALFTAFGVGFALVLDSSAGGRWAAPVVLVIGLVTVGFYGWAIYSTVHPLPTDRQRAVQAVIEPVEPGGPDLTTTAVEPGQSPEGESR